MLAASLLLAALWACDDKPAGGGAPSADAKNAASNAAATNASAATTTAAATASATAASGASAAPSAEASAAASVAASSAASGTAGSSASSAATGAASSAASATAKTFECGAKGQKACPMQGWMKGVMTRAVADADPEKLAAALNTVASKPVPEFSNWTAIAAAGAAKAKAGDIDGAKESCKKCHAAYQKTYKQTMRDRPW